jgi:hypothetical protein
MTIGEKFFLDKPFHKQTAKFNEFEGKVYEIQFFFVRELNEI